MSVQQCAAEAWRRGRAEHWSGYGWVHSGLVRLLEAPEEKLLLAAYRPLPDSEPLVLLVSPRARQAGRTGKWFGNAYGSVGARRT